MLGEPIKLQWNSPYLLLIQRRTNGGKLEKILASVTSKGGHVFHGRKLLGENGIDFAPKEYWMGNSPDCAMDFCANGLIKWDVFDRQLTTIEGLKRVATEVWRNLDQTKIQNAFKSLYGRVKMMVECGGHHIEHNLKQKQYRKSS